MRQSAKFRNDRRQQLHHDRRADVGHDAERKNCAILQRAAAEKIEERRDIAAGFSVSERPKPLLDDGLIDARGRDGGAKAHDHDHGEREQDPPAKFRYFDVFRKAETID